MVKVASTYYSLGYRRTIMLMSSYFVLLLMACNSFFLVGSPPHGQGGRCSLRRFMDGVGLSL